MTDEAMLDEVLIRAVAYVKLSLEPVQVQHRWRLPEFTLSDGGEPRWSKWSGWKNGPVRGRVEGWEYEERGLYAL